MKKIIIPLIITLVINTFAQTKVTSYNINAEYNPAANKISVSASLKFQQDGLQDTLRLLFNSNNNILAITTPLNENNFDLVYFKSGKDTLSIILNKNINNGNYFAVNFDYEYPLEKDSIILLDRGHRWYPMIAEDIFSFTMTVRVPESYVAVSAGDVINEKVTEGFKQISFESTQPVFKIPLIIAPENYYTVKKKECGKIKSYFYEIKSQSLYKLDSVNTDICNLINYFSTTIGEYPHKRFTLVETSAFPGSNLGSSIVTSGIENFESYISGNKDWLYMAIASQWIGTGVFPKLFCNGFWFLSISFPHYLRLMYENDSKGDKYFDKEISNLTETYKKIAGGDGDIPIIDIDYPNTKEKGILLYAKGVIVLNKLKMQLGEVNWVNLLKYFYSQYSGKVITLDDLINSINKFDSSETSSNKLLNMLSTKGFPD